MCGILGIVGAHVERERLRLMAMTMRHRGPDAGGIAEWADGAFAHRRLSVIDTADTANQPFHDARGRAVLVFNGEIYNYRELRSAFESRGQVFRTDSDTEVLLAAYLEWGADCVNHLNGMFAFAVWDFRTHELFLGRDRLGKKPLYYARLPAGGVLFASELKPFLASGLVDSALDAEALHDYLCLNYILCPKTPLRQVRQLPPAGTATWRSGVWKESSYWDLADAYLDNRSTETDATLLERMGELSEDATSSRLFSDVPLGAFLSGGVDSSTVVALMREHTEGLHTFSVEFPSPEFNEGAYSRLAARHLGTQHHPHVVDERVLDFLIEFAHRMDVPLGDDSAVSVYLLAREARKSVTVALSGDGADELFAGYVTYQADAWHRRLGALRRPAALALRVLGPWLPEAGAKLSRRFRAEQLRRGLERPSLDAHFTWREVAGLDTELAPEIARGSAGYSPVDVFRAYHDRVRGADWLDRLLYVDARTWLVDDILVKADRATMAASLECRSPFVDFRLAEFAARLPRRLKLGGGEKKVILKRLARQFLPSEIVDRKKSGFNSPTADWLRGPLRDTAEELFRSGSLESLGVRWNPTLATRWRTFLGGARQHQYSLWGLFCLGLWERHVLKGWRESASASSATGNDFSDKSGFNRPDAA
jgi:asparagine synthase (glutamine-hydrolysing)